MIIDVSRPQSNDPSINSIALPLQSRIKAFYLFIRLLPLPANDVLPSFHEVC